MKVLWRFIGILVLLMVVATTTAKDQDSQKVLQFQKDLLVETEIPYAFQGIDLAETLPIDNAEAQEIRGTGWQILPFIYLIGHYAGTYGPTVLEIKDFLEALYEAGVSLAEIIAFW